MGPTWQCHWGGGSRGLTPVHVDLIAGVTPAIIPCGGFLFNGISEGHIMRCFHWIEVLVALHRLGPVGRLGVLCTLAGDEFGDDRTTTRRWNLVQGTAWS